MIVKLQGFLSLLNALSSFTMSGQDISVAFWEEGFSDVEINFIKMLACGWLYGKVLLL